VQTELEGVAKAYGTTVVLRDVALTVPEGEFLAIVGQSGSGKSTLLKLIGGLDTPDRGRVRHRGTDLAAMTERERAFFRRSALGFVFQFFNLIPTLSAWENVALPLTLNGRREADALRIATEVLEELGVAACARRFPDELSGGEQQRIAIARALVHEPQLVVADEPTGNLDLETAGQVLDVLERSCRRRGTTLIVATHSDAVARHADRVLGVVAGGLEDART
jgi:putative ABC transport system ATP-binding protein